MVIKILLLVSMLGISANAASKASTTQAAADAQFASERAAYKEELKKSSRPGLTSMVVSSKYGVSGLVALCQVNYKKLIELAEDKNLTESARTEKELPLLAKETDKRCRKAYYQYVDLCAELRSRDKAPNTSPAGAKQTK